MTFKKSDEVIVLNKSAVEYLCGLIRNTTKLSDSIDDLNLRTDGSFSSVKVNQLLTILKEDCTEYTDTLVSNLSRLELKIANTMDEITKANILYLYKEENATTYSEYVVIDGEQVLLGTTEINMTDYYNKTEIDEKFVLQTDFDTLKENKLDNKFDSADSGKSLVIDDSGKVIVGDVADTSWTGTMEEFTNLDKSLLKNGQQINIIDDYNKHENLINDGVISNASTWSSEKINKTFIDEVLKGNVGKKTILFMGAMKKAGTYSLTDKPIDYDYVVINLQDVYSFFLYNATVSREQIAIMNHNVPVVCESSDKNGFTLGYFEGSTFVLTNINSSMMITSIVGFKIGEVTVQNTITNPSQGDSYSIDEQLTGGTWIDGKPIYRKVHICTMETQLDANCDWTKIQGWSDKISNLKEYVNINFNHINYASRLDFSIQADNSLRFGCLASSLTVKVGSPLILEYTKTTDA